MSKFHIATTVATFFLPAAALAEPLKVVTDIAPVQSLVQMVAGDLAGVDVIVPPGASPHGYSMRPSEARALQDADLVVWIGPDLAPWMSDPIDTIAEQARVIELASVPGTMTLAMREGATFAAHDHGDGDHDHDHDHDAHDEHADSHDHDDHDHDHAHDDDHDHDHGSDKDAEAAADHDGHDHGAFDPHLWLFPQNVQNWVSVVASEMSALDPGNADVYAANAVAGIARIDAAVADAQALLSGLNDRPFVSYHDAFQYYEQAFGLAAAGALSLSDATPPSAARIREIRDLVEDEGVVCAFSEPQFDPGLVETVFGDDAEIKVAVLDPLGAELPSGPELYPTLITSIAASAADCLR